MKFLNVFDIILCIIGISLHTLALLLMKSIKGAHKVLQKEYMMVLCSMEIWICVGFTIASTTHENQEKSMILNVFLAIFLTGFVSYQYILLALIVIDKFICIYMPLKYNNLFTKRYINGILIVVAITSSSIASAFLALYLCFDKSYTEVLQLAAMCVWVPFDIIVLTISIFVYGYFAAIRSKLKQLDAWRQLLASTAILVSFILFYIIPDFITAITGDDLEGLHSVIFTLFILNSICDAVFVIFLNKVLRKKLKQMLCGSNEVIPVTLKSTSFSTR